MHYAVSQADVELCSQPEDAVFCALNSDLHRLAGTGRIVGAKAICVNVLWPECSVSANAIAQVPEDFNERELQSTIAHDTILTNVR